MPGATTYAPMLLGVARVSYSDAKLGLDDTRMVTVTRDHGRAVGRLGSLGDRRLHGRSPAQGPPAGATFADVPACGKAKNYARGKDFAQWIGQSQSIELFKSTRAKAVSSLDESERDFRIRLQTEAREARDKAVATLRQDYASKIAREQDQVRRAEQAVQKQTEQASGAKLQTAVSVGAAILGAFMGRKMISATSLGRATTAARGAERIGRESADVTRASEDLEKEKRELAEVRKVQAEIRSIHCCRSSGTVRARADRTRRRRSTRDPRGVPA